MSRLPSGTPRSLHKRDLDKLSALQLARLSRKLRKNAVAAARMHRDRTLPRYALLAAIGRLRQVEKARTRNRLRNDA